MVAPLLATKLFLPPIRAERVQRARLLNRLDEALRPTTRLALISAPAGFGKSSLLAEWIASRSLACAWLSLDAGDNHPDTFLAYLTGAVERALPGCLPETAALLRAGQSAGAEPVPAQTILAVMVNELASATASLDRPLLVALDDFHVIASQEVRQAAAFLIEHLPPNARLAVATRADPPLPLARLRARGQMVELRAADLRFTEEEAEDFLLRGMGLRLDPAYAREAAAAITARTEGWAAGLQMAALALQSAGESSAAEFLRTFSGSHRYVLDYLAEEVLSRLSAQTVAFLLQTALFDRFSASLCAASVQWADGNSGAPSSESEFQALLEGLERSNLFLVPLDGERRWYRYHHLFADLLRARMKASIPPDAAAAIHRRASAWFEQAGLTAEAIQQALSAAGYSTGEEADGDYERAAVLVERNTLGLFRRGELHAVLRLVDLLPAQISARRPWLCVYRAWAFVFRGQMDMVEPLLAQAGAGAGLLEEEARRELAGHQAAIRCHRLLILNQLDELFVQARITEQTLPESSWARGTAAWTVGFALRTRGELDRARGIFERLVQRARAEKDPWGLCNTATDLGIILRQQGRLPDALHLYEQSLAFLESVGARRLGYVSRLLSALSFTLYEQNRLDEAQARLEEAARLNDLWHNPNNTVFSHLNMARVLTARAEYDQANEKLAAALQVIRDLPVVNVLEQSVQASQMRVQLAAGRVPPAAGPLEAMVQAGLNETPGLAFNEGAEVRNTLLARLLLAQRRPADGLRLIDRLEQTARHLGRASVLIEVLTLRALCLDMLGQAGGALRALEEAVSLAEPQNALRPIVDCAPHAPGALSRMLRDLRSQGAAWPAFIDSLLAAAGEPEPQPALARPTAQAQTSALVEPLSERELEVLGLLAAGLTNAQIAARLVISTGTVKAHTANIFRKLDAENRTQAVAIARDAGLIQ